jgi:uncharacterized membrane protein YsdA (DUF1294 family)
MDTKVIVAAAVFLAVMNACSFCLMAYDKHCAKRGEWRVSEKSLFLTVACFGALGGVLGMQLLRHKTKHWYFRLFFPLMLVVQTVIVGSGVYRLFYEWRYSL